MQSLLERVKFGFTIVGELSQLIRNSSYIKIFRDGRLPEIPIALARVHCIHVHDCTLLESYVNLSADKKSRNKAEKPHLLGYCLLNLITWATSCELRDALKSPVTSVTLQWVARQCYHSQKAQTHCLDLESVKHTEDSREMHSAATPRSCRVCNTFPTKTRFNASQWLKQERQYIPTTRAHNMAKVCRRQTRGSLKFKLDFNSERPTARAMPRSPLQRHQAQEKIKRIASARKALNASTVTITETCVCEDAKEK